MTYFMCGVTVGIVIATVVSLLTIYFYFDGKENK